MSEQNPLQKLDDEVIEQTNQEWNAWAMMAILALVAMPLCIIGAFLYRDNQTVFAIFAGASICLVLTIAVSAKKSRGAQEKTLSAVRQFPKETYDLTVFIQLESEGSDTFLGLLQSPIDSFWIQITGTPERKERLRDLPPKEEIPVSVQKSNDPKSPILVSLKGLEFTGWRTNKRGTPPDQRIGLDVQQG